MALIGELIVGSLTDKTVTVERCTPSEEAAGAPVPQTGQTASEASGDDGFVKAGVPFPEPRFTVNNPDGTITDNLTGLMWLQDAFCPDASRSWEDALLDVAELNTSGTMNGNACAGYTAAFDDWRLPNVRELHRLIHFGINDPAIPDTAGTSSWLSDGDAFTKLQTAVYWSSTIAEPNHAFAWDVSFSNGIVTNNLTSDSFFVLPVRGP